MNSVPTAIVDTDAYETLANNSRSFWFASLFLPSEMRLKAAQLYRFCRTLDDAVDEAPSSTLAALRVKQYRAELESRHSSNPAVIDFLALHRQNGVPMWAALGLLEGMESDLGPVRMRDDGDLLLYCYRAAGTVGVMMCGVLGVTHPKALAPAIDLGIAMQLTNICRDVLEDAGRNRVYLPANRLHKWGTHTEALIQGRAPTHSISNVVSELLTLADYYYEKGRCGLHYIPWRARFPIHVAAAVYQQIGHRLRRCHECNSMVGRTIVPFPEKLWSIFKHSVRAAARMVFNVNKRTPSRPAESQQWVNAS